MVGVELEHGTSNTVIQCVNPSAKYLHLAYI